MNRSILVAALLLVPLILLGCGGKETPAPEAPAQSAPNPPTPAEAKELIVPSAEFSDFQSPYSGFSLPMKKSLIVNNEVQMVADDLKAAGYIDWQGEDLVLTEKTGGDRRWMVRPNGFVDIVPLAKKELVEVTDVVAGPDGTVAAEFTWKWIPNEVGASLVRGRIRERFDALHHGVAKLQPASGGGWEILTISPREPPAGAAS
ncbi:MAG TPA: hypothetical protein VMT00_01590 [Thermoanaerobaculia bacterium]|nr:hypothetical protein [Thermoanaerobaculia bacterium]